MSKIFFNIILIIIISFFISLLLSIIIIGFSNNLISTINKNNDYLLNNDYNVYIQDQTTFPFDIYAHTIVTNTFVTSSNVINSYNVTVDNVSGASVGMAIDVLSNVNFYQSLIVGIDGNTLILASPLDFNVDIGDIVTFGEWDFSTADGSVNPVSFYVHVPSSVSYDFYTMTLSIEDTSVMYDSTFGSLPSLSNGFIGRAVDGASKTFFIITNNGGFRENGFTTVYPTKVPSGSYAFSAVKNIKEVNGVALRLDGSSNDYLEFIVRDDFTDLDKMAVAVHGHEVED